MKLDLHIHSTFSDGLNSIEDIVKRAKKVGLGGIGLSDHNTVRGHRIAKKLCKEHGLAFVPAIEVTAQEGHILGIGVQEVVKKGPAAEVIDGIHQQGGLAIAPHPYDIFRHGIGNLVKSLKFDLIETFNSRVIFPPFNSRAKTTAKELGMKNFAASDAHWIYEIGLGAIETAGVDDLYKKKFEVCSEKWAGLGVLTIETVRRKIIKYSNSKNWKILISN